MHYVCVTQGKCALEAVQLVADLVKRRHCVTPPAVVRVLLVLRFEQVRPEDVAQQGKGGKGGKKKGGKKGGKNKGGVLGEVERDFAEAQAAPDAQEQALLQSQMLEVSCLSVMEEIYITQA
jgi:nucleolar complex protein 3